jgi:ribosomal protein L24E
MGLETADDTADETADEKLPASAKTETPTESFAPVKLGGGSKGATGSPATAKSSRSVEQSYNDVKKALKVVQVLIGEWHGIADKAPGATKSFEEFHWIWDVRTDKAQPALTMKTDNSPYMKSARLTYLIDEQRYQLTILDKEDRTRDLRGTFTEEPAFQPGEDKKQTPQRVYKLQLTETGDAKGRWQVVMNQRDNNRYLLELSRAQGNKFNRFDTIGNQREGTSFALNDSDFKEKTCVISQGLGTISVSHKGKQYWVCCSGCKAAFEEDPEKWIAKFEAMQTEKK